MTLWTHENPRKLGSWQYFVPHTLSSLTWGSHQACYLLSSTLHLQAQLLDLPSTVSAHLLQDLKFHVLLWHLWASEGSKGLTVSPPILGRYDIHQVGSVPHEANSSISRTSYVCSIALQHNRFHFPASLWNYSNKSVTSSCRSQRSFNPLVMTKLASCSSWSTLLLSAHEMRYGPAWPMAPSYTGACVTN